MKSDEDGLMKSDEDGVMKSDEEEDQSDENGVLLSEVI